MAYGLRSTALLRYCTYCTYLSQCSKVLHHLHVLSSPAGRRSVPVTLPTRLDGDIRSRRYCRRVRSTLLYISPCAACAVTTMYRHSAGPTLPRTHQYTPAQFPVLPLPWGVQPRVLRTGNALQRSLFPRDSSSQIQPLSSFQAPRSAGPPPRSNYPILRPGPRP